MGLTSTTEEAKAKKLAGLYNMVPNMVWSILNITPIVGFWYMEPNRKFFYISLAISALPILFPRKVFEKWRLGATATTYKRAGVVFIVRFTQNGSIINRLMRKNYPAYRVVSPTRTSVESLINQTYIFEKFHYIFLIFFSLTLFYTLRNHLAWWSMIIFLTNILYNIYPILMQQYVRLKLTSARNRSMK